MSTLKKYIGLIFLLQGGCVYSMNTDPVDAIDIKHITRPGQGHLYNMSLIKIGVITNKDNGVLSVLVDINKRKTIFPKGITRDNLEDNLMEICQNGEFLGNGLDINTKYIRLGKLVVVIVKGAREELENTIRTAYPILRYISLDEIENADNDLEVYIATVYKKNKKTNKSEWKDINSVASDIKTIRDSSNIIAYRKENEGREICIKDISLYYSAEIFGVERFSRGSILLEVRAENIKRQK